MSIFKRLEDIENKLQFLEKVYPDWIPVSKHLASQYGYSINGFRNYCLSNIDPLYFKKFGSQYHINKQVLHLLHKK